MRLETVEGAFEAAAQAGLVAGNQIQSAGAVGERAECGCEAGALVERGASLLKFRSLFIAAARRREDLRRADVSASGVAVPPDRDEDPVRCFETFTTDLERLADWLQHCRIRAIAMESTGVYWIPLFQILEKRRIEVRLVNAHHVRNVPGKKTDVEDCQWIQHLHACGLLRGSFRPVDAVCAIRSLWRHRENLIELATIHLQHMQKALDQMNVQLHHVISDLAGATRLAIVDRSSPASAIRPNSPSCETGGFGRRRSR
jgi:hypothetical protein